MLTLHYMENFFLKLKIFLATIFVCTVVLLFSLGIVDEGTVSTFLTFGGIPTALIVFGIYATYIKIKSFRRGEIKFDQVVLASIPLLIGILFLLTICIFLDEVYG